MRQLSHDEIQNSSHSGHIRLICDHIKSPDNVGMIFRVCEAFSVEEIVFIGNDLTTNKRAIKAARSTMKAIEVKVYQTHHDFPAKDYYPLIAIERTDVSHGLTDFVFTNRKINLVLGEESTGVSQNLLSHCSDSVHITQFGKNSSMNVVTALSIVLFEAIKQLT